MIGFNAFTADGDETLKKIGIITTEDDASFTIRIWDRFEEGALLDQLVTHSGTFEHQGLHTVDLPIPITLTQEDDFFVELEVSSGGLAFDRTSDIPVLLGASTRTIVESHAATGESFVLQGSTWVDFTLIEATGNLCIKAMTSGPELFSDGFENGDTSGWSVTTP